METATEWAVIGADSGADSMEDFDAVVRRYWPRIFRFALVSLRDKGAAESLAQDCFLKAYQARDRFRGDSSVGTWLMQIAVNLIRDNGRNRRLRFWKLTRSSPVDVATVGEMLADGRLSPESAASTREQMAAVWNATAALPEKQRTVFLLRFVEDMDLNEIAAATGLREGTIKSHLFRALQAIRKRLGGKR